MFKITLYNNGRYSVRFSNTRVTVALNGACLVLESLFVNNDLFFSTACLAIVPMTRGELKTAKP